MKLFFYFYLDRSYFHTTVFKGANLIQGSFKENDKRTSRKQLISICAFDFPWSNMCSDEEYKCNILHTHHISQRTTCDSKSLSQLHGIVGFIDNRLL